MNIKRAFLAAAAALMVPGFAMAQTVDATFDTSIDFSNDFDGSVNVELTCNGGTPLVQDADISEGSAVQFTVLSLDTATRTCSITIADLASGYETATVCEFVGGTNLSDSNTCDILATPVASEIEVYVDWTGVDDPSISQFAELEISCSPASTDTGPNYGTVSTMVSGIGDSDYFLDFYPTTAAGGTTCSVEVNEDALDSAVEGLACADIEGIMIGDAIVTCDVTFTAFFEGIPTLGQYGKAIMVLLMLGVGFVGFRRFV